MMLPYQDSRLSIKDRVNDLLKRMSLQEKVGQVNQHLYGWESYAWQKQDRTVTFKKKFIDHVNWGKGLGAIYGLFRADPWSKVDFDNGVPAEDSWMVTNAIQEYVIKHSRWGIPALIVEECPHGHQGLGGISYPTNIGKGNTFDPQLIKRSAQMMSEELSSKGINLALVSTMDLAKDPRWGRTEECYGEDPLLTSKMTQAIIEGFQGSLIDDKKFTNETVEQANKRNRRLGVVIKHCIAQGEAQGGHNSGTVVIGKRDIYDIYDPILKSAKNAVGIMAAYNDINGVPCHINKKLLRDKLRKQYGFQGLIMSDGVALDRLNDAVHNKYIAANLALNAGVDLSLWDNTYTQIQKGIELGIINVKALNEAVRHVLTIKFLLGLFDHPYITAPKSRLKVIRKKSQQINKKIAEESITLVKNDGVLPVSIKKYKKIAVIGPNANNFYNMLGDYTAPQSEEMCQRTIYGEIKKIFTNSEVSYSLGCEIRNIKNQEDNISSAVKLAKKSDVIVLVLGGSSTRSFKTNFMENGAAIVADSINMDTGENIDLASLSLGGKQIELFNKLRKTSKPIISILIQGRPYDIENIVNYSDAVLIGWYPGQMGGVAIANVLGGYVNPSGKLSMSYPINSEQLPVYYYQRDAAKQDDYYDESGAPLFEFGYGMGYSKFVYKNLNIVKHKNILQINFQVENVGKFAGEETALVFTKLIGGNVLPRKKILKAFDRKYINKGCIKDYLISIPLTDLKILDLQNKEVLPDKVEVLVNNLKETISLT